MSLHESVIALPSGTEISVQVALSDLHRIKLELLNETENDDYDVDFSGEASDLDHIAELVELMSGDLATAAGMLADLRDGVLPDGRWPEVDALVETWELTF